MTWIHFVITNTRLLATNGLYYKNILTIVSDDQK
jgi:hypothetical protein